MDTVYSILFLNSNQQLETVSSMILEKKILGHVESLVKKDLFEGEK